MGTVFERRDSTPDGPQEGEAEPLRYCGEDADGKSVYVSSTPGGLLEAVADTAALEYAAVWHALVQPMTEGPQLTADEANFMLARIVEALGAVLPIAGRVAESHRDRLARFTETGRDIALCEPVKDDPEEA